MSASSTDKTTAHSSSLGIVCPWTGATLAFPIKKDTSHLSCWFNFSYTTDAIASLNASLKICISLKFAALKGILEIFLGIFNSSSSFNEVARSIHGCLLSSEISSSHFTGPADDIILRRSNLPHNCHLGYKSHGVENTVIGWENPSPSISFRLGGKHKSKTICRYMPWESGAS